MERILNRRTYYVNEHEFILYNDSEYTTLKLYPQLGIFEREIGLIKELVESFREVPYYEHIDFINIGLSHGGFLPIELTISKNFHNHFIIYNKDDQHLINFTKNYELHKDSIDDAKIIVANNLDDIISPNSLKIVRIQADQQIISNSYIFDTVTIILSYQQLFLTSHKLYMLKESKLLIYIPYNLINIFEDHFRYYLEADNLNYDNLLHLCMIVKNAGPNFGSILEQNLPFIDRWTILDTGSTDNTVQTIKEVMKSKKGELYEEPFIDFGTSRNRCLDLAGQVCKFTIMLDDTYVLQGDKLKEFLQQIRSDQYADSYNIFICGEFSLYGSNRLIKTDRNLRYIYKIHEIIRITDNIVVQLPKDKIYIKDDVDDYMMERTYNRKQSDLKLLFEEIEENPDDPRLYFYVAQTYIELEEWSNAYEYFKKRINHPNEGYPEEITESLLMCGHLGEFKLDHPKSKYKEWYKRCHNYEKTRPDPLVALGYYYFRKNKIVKAYNHYVEAFNLGLPKNATSNLRLQTYNIFLPETLAHLCYQFKNYELGFEATQRYIKNNRPNQTVNSYDKIFRLLQLDNKIKKGIRVNNAPKISNKKIFCFVTDGGYKPWSGRTIYTEGLGGSETFLVEMARNLANILDHDINVFCQTDIEGPFEGVTYRHIDSYVEFLNQNKIDVCVISRFSEYIPVTIFNGVKNIYLHLEDLGPSGNIIPVDDALKKILCMTNWHQGFFSENFPYLKDKADVFPNGIDINKFIIPDGKIKKKKHSFMYSSFPNRGLIILLKMFPKIKEKFPDATLNIFCNTKHHVMQQIAKEEMDEIDRLLEEQQSYVVNHGWVSKDVLNKYWQNSEIWLYPCTFAETFCITALECAASCTLAITSDLAALNDVVGDRGILIPGNPKSEEWQTLAINKLVDILDDKNKDKRVDLIRRNRLWATSLDWKILAKKMVEECINSKDDQNIKYVKSDQLDINFKINLYENEFISNIIREHIFFEPYTTEILCELMSKYEDHMFVDIGANIGYFSMLVASKNIDVVAFEPIKKNYELFEKSVVENNFGSKIKLHKFGLGENSGILDFNICEFNMGLCSGTHNLSNVDYTEKVNIYKFDDCFNNEEIKRKLIVKIDVELMELDVLKGMVKTFESDKITAILIEISKSDDFKEIFELLINYGFKYVYNLGVVYMRNSPPTITSYLKNINFINDSKTFAENIGDDQHMLLFVKEDYSNKKLETGGMLNWSHDVPKGSKQIFLSILSRFKDKKCKILEIGTYAGTSIIEMLNYLPDSLATTIDIWTDYEEGELSKSMESNKIEYLFYQNIGMAGFEDRIKSIKGDSKDVLIDLIKLDQFFDFIYVDGSHKCLDCYLDMVLVWQLLENGGVLAVDDYLWNPGYIKDEKLDLPYYAVEHFMEKYKGRYNILHKDYRIFFEKLN